jgi:hypothetical protein
VALAHDRPYCASFYREHAFYWPIADAAARLAQRAPEDWPARVELDALHAEAARNAQVPALSFVPYARRPRGESVRFEQLYDGAIARLRHVPTREGNWHDLFNALSFASFPRSKHALHARQAALLEARLRSSGGKLYRERTPEQDALTLLDEGGCVVAASEARIARLTGIGELTARDLLASDDGGPLWLAPFGHALSEHWVEGLRCPGACAVLLALSPRVLRAPRAELLTAIDGALARQLERADAFVRPSERARIELADLEPSAWVPW